MGKMQGSPKKRFSSREPGNEAALVYRDWMGAGLGGEVRSGMSSRERGVG